MPFRKLLTIAEVLFFIQVKVTSTQPLDVRQIINNVTEYRQTILKKINDLSVIQTAKLSMGQVIFEETSKLFYKPPCKKKKVIQFKGSKLSEEQPELESLIGIVIRLEDY